ncbi:MAG: phosphoglycerol geranylgeranyltransferase [Bacteroidota bacterium]
MKFKKLIKSLHKGKRCLFAVLVDPDKFNPLLISMANSCNVDCFLVGGSYLHSGNLNKTIIKIKEISNIPVLLFPGDETQLSEKADGLFLPSLLSGRNADYLITKQVVMAPIIQKMNLKHAPMAYLLLDGNTKSSTEKVTKTQPLSFSHKKQVLDTALAAQYLGFELLYLEAGSGAKKSIPPALIKQVKEKIRLPLIVGGGINTAQKVKDYIHAGANMIVVGNALEKNINLLKALSACFDHTLKTSKHI